MMLKKGSVGKDVVILQNILGIKPDGEFGLITEEAVKNWQVKNSLTPDGVIKNNEWIKMGFADSILKLDVLKPHIPETVIMQISETAAKFNINNVLRLSHFLAQCGHESGGFRVVVENLNYSAQRLTEIFPKYFPNSLNESYAKQPKKIANKVYANRMGNGNELSGDGYKFRGRGYIQLTGMSNYAAFDKIVNENILLNPELVATKYPLMSAAFFFDVNKIWNVCDKGSTDTIITAVTKKVNGGTIGLADRIKHFKKYYTLLNK